jgi:hypothetical protein
LFPPAICVAEDRGRLTGGHMPNSAHFSAASQPWQSPCEPAGQYHATSFAGRPRRASGSPTGNFVLAADDDGTVPRPVKSAFP